MADPLARTCDLCDASSGELCDCVSGLHWMRARAVGMSPNEFLEWRPTERPKITLPPSREELDFALTALRTAIDLAEQYGAPQLEIAALRGIARRIHR